ncbi:MAG: phosphohydrolase [Planctomycetia bacterium 21-64-5]|nr:MAG: phosphohydrolase [Planctomycetia bacterium 21-64-5]HQU44828.1 HDOD domain-containing protein [Pirellulales bacterium]
MSQTAVAAELDLTKLLAGAQLPALPQSAIQLLELSNDQRNGPTQFAVPIEADPGLAGQVLKFVNSAYFGFAREISSVKLAITLVGIRTIKNFTLWSAVFSLMPNPKCGMFDLRSLWQDSLRRALFARSFARMLGMREAEEPFAAALLQDMAVPLLAKELSAEYAVLLADRQQGKLRLSQLERERFGWTHAHAAAQMARQWNLPEEFATLIERHTELDSLSSSENVPPGDLAVALSSLLPAVGDDAWCEVGQFDACYRRFCPAGGPRAAEFLRTIDAEFVAFAPVLKIAAPARSLEMRYADAVT